MARKRRVSTRYLPHLAEIAEIHVECQERAAETARRAREEIGLLLTEDTLRGWMAKSPEFQAALEGARGAAANKEAAQPELRVPQSVAKLQEYHAKLCIRWEAGEDKALKQLLDVQAAIRAEEKHLADLEDRRARRDFERFLRCLVAYVKASHARSADVVLPILRAALKSLDAVVRLDPGRGAA